MQLLFGSVCLKILFNTFQQFDNCDDVLRGKAISKVFTYNFFPPRTIYVAVAELQHPALGRLF